jgi:hypothetical protein
VGIKINISEILPLIRPAMPALASQCPVSPDTTLMATVTSSILMTVLKISGNEVCTDVPTLTYTRDRTTGYTL